MDLKKMMKKILTYNERQKLSKSVLTKIAPIIDRYVEVKEDIKILEAELGKNKDVTEGLYPAVSRILDIYGDQIMTHKGSVVNRTEVVNPNFRIEETEEYLMSKGLLRKCSSLQLDKGKIAFYVAKGIIPQQDLIQLKGVHYKINYYRRQK